MTRYFVWQLSGILVLLFFGLTIVSGELLWWILLAVSLTIFGVGIVDQIQTKHSLLRNYPVIGHLRFWLEFIRPEIRQYFIESDREKLPFSRNQRALVYQRSKNVSDQRSFGTIDDVYQPNYEWLSQSSTPLDVSQIEDLRVQIGNEQCVMPYSASIFNISAMSFGALSANAILALNKGAKLGGFAHDTGEGSVSPYHLQNGGDLIWEIGSGYFGCRTPAGQFDIDLYAQVAQLDSVKMIEIKLSQGAKPGHGGVLPAAKITPEIAFTRKIPMGQDCISPAAHTAFKPPIEMLEFVTALRVRSGGKPIGFKLCIGQPGDWFAIVKAMLETGIYPDFFVIDGSEGGTGSAPTEFVDHVGMPMRDGLRLVHATLIGVGLRDQVRIGAAGKIISGFDMVRTSALGADWCNSARGFMFALGCIQSRSCNTDQCPTGVATQNPLRQRSLDPVDKAQRVYNFHQNTLKALRGLLASAGVSHPRYLTPQMMMCRSGSYQSEYLAALILDLEEGALLQRNGAQKLNQFQAGLGDAWNSSSASRFS